MSVTTVSCPTCQAKVVWNEQSQFRPFCCKRCQLIDLGEWAEEQKVIPGNNSKEQQPGDVPDIEDIEAMLASQQQDFFKH